MAIAWSDGLVQWKKSTDLKLTSKIKNGSVVIAF